jgi:hypothetical protein
MTMWRVLVVMIAACAADQPPRAEPPRRAAPQAPEHECVVEPPIGDPSQLTLRSVPGFTIAEPVTCKQGSYIRIERLSGARRLGVAEVPHRGFSEGCSEVSKFATCSTINVGALLLEAATELRREGIPAAGDGAGPCAPDLDAGYDGWNFATGVHDWKHVDRVVAKITELMNRYDLAGYVGVAVRPTPCFKFL